LTGTVHDWELVCDENGPGGRGTNFAWTEWMKRIRKMTQLSNNGKREEFGILDSKWISSAC